MPQQFTTVDQVNFLNNWFDTWSELQKDDFLPILAQTVNPEQHINGLTGSIPDIPEDKKKTTIFDCQVKLFHEWFGCWEENERQEFLNHIKETDNVFSSRLEKAVDGNFAERFNNLETDQTLSLSPLSLNEIDDGIAGHTSSSSTLSSLTQSQSNNDSGLEANKSNSEQLKEEN